MSDKKKKKKAKAAKAVTAETAEDEDVSVKEKDAGSPADSMDTGIDRKMVAAATDDVNAIYKEGIAAAKELKGAFDEIKSALNLGDLFKDLNLK